MSRAALGFAIAEVVGIVLVCVIPTQMEVKMAAIAALGPLGGAAGGIYQGRGDSTSSSAPRYAPPKQGGAGE